MALAELEFALEMALGSHSRKTERFNGLVMVDVCPSYLSLV
jgi:hypothetical protein